MTTVSWKNNADGDWSVALNWTPVAPSSTTDVVIATASPHTITHSAGTHKILSLTVSPNDVLTMTGGVLTVLGNSSLHTLLQSGGTLRFGGVTSTVSGNMAQTVGGTIAVSSGVLRLTSGSDSLAGTLTGAAVEFAGAAATIVAGAALAMNRVLVSSGVLTLTENVTEAGIWTQTGGTIVDAYTLTLSGPAIFTAGTVSDALIAAKGTTSIHALTLSNAVLTNTGSVTESGVLRLGSGTTGGTLNNLGGGRITLQGASSIGAGLGSQFRNRATLVKAGAGTTEIDPSTTADSLSTIEVNGGVLRFSQGHNEFDGKITGPGMLEFLSGIDAFDPGLQLSTGAVTFDGATVVVPGVLAYAGTWTQTAGTILLGGTHDVTLSGVANFDGGVVSGGTIIVTSTATAEITSLQMASDLDNRGSIFQNGALQLGSNFDHAVLTNEAGATFTIAPSTNINSSSDASSVVNAGTFVKIDAGLSVVTASTITSTGTIVIDAGTLALASTDGSATLGGTITGAGVLQLNRGNYAFPSGLQLTTAGFSLGPVRLDLLGAMTYAGNWVQTAGTLFVEGASPTLTLTGEVSLGAGTINGGTVAMSGPSVINGLHAGNGLVLKNTGTMTEAGTWYLGQYATDAAALDNGAGGTFRIVGNASLSSSSNAATFTNAGAVVKLGSGAAGISVSTTNAGAISIKSGELRFFGANDRFGGGIGGAGTLTLAGGTRELLSTLKLATGGVSLTGGVLTVDGARTYAGAWAQTGGTVTLTSKPFTLTGTASFSGGAVQGEGILALASTSAGEISSYALDGSVTLDNKGDLIQTGIWSVGGLPADTAVFKNEATGTFDIAADANILSVASKASIVNAGTFEKTGGSGTISVNATTINDGLVDVGSGGMTFLKPASGTGTFEADAGASLRFGAAVAAGSTIMLGADAELFVTAGTGFGASIAGFAAGDVIELTGLNFAGTSFTFSLGKLTVTNGAISAKLNLTGSYTPADFVLVSDNGVAAIVHS